VGSNLVDPGHVVANDVRISIIAGRRSVYESSAWRQASALRCLALPTGRGPLKFFSFFGEVVELAEVGRNMGNRRRISPERSRSSDIQADLARQPPAWRQVRLI